MSRPELKPGTTHSTTKYEVEARMIHGGRWYLNQTVRDLDLAKKAFDVINAIDNLEGRIVVVSETRRLI